MKSQPWPVLDLPENLDTAEGCREALADLARQEADLEGALDAARAERRELAMDIARGVPAAMKRNEALNAQQVDVMGKLDLLLVVRSAVQEKLAGVEAAEAAVAAEAKRGRLRAGAEAAERLATEVDAAAGVLKAKLDGFQASVNGMVRDGLDTARANKLRNSTKLRAALQAAGLGGHLGLERVAAMHREALESWTRRILAGELGQAAPEQAPAPDPRALPSQVGPVAYGLPAVSVATSKPDPSVRW